MPKAQVLEALDHASSLEKKAEVDSPYCGTDPSWDRYHEARAVFRGWGEGAVAPLLEIFHGGARRQSKMALVALQDMGPVTWRALPGMLRAFKRARNKAPLHRVIESIACRHNCREVPALTSLIASKDERTVRMAAGALWRIGARAASAVDPIVRRIKGSRLQGETLYKLYYTLVVLAPNSEKVRATLRSGLSNKRDEVRTVAFMVLEQLVRLVEGRDLIDARWAKRHPRRAAYMQRIGPPAGPLGQDTLKLVRTAKGDSSPTVSEIARRLERRLAAPRVPPPPIAAP